MPLSIAELGELRALLGSRDASQREGARRRLTQRLRSSDRAAVLAHWVELRPDEVAARSGWLAVVRARAELMTWLHEAWLERGSLAAREWVVDILVEVIRGSSQVGEDRRPVITCFPPARWRIEPGASAWDIASDLDQLASAKLPLVLDPRMGPEALAPIQLPLFATGARPDELLTATALARDATIGIQGGCLWIGRKLHLADASVPDLAERLISSAESGNEFERRLAFAALAALGLPGWHDRCEERALASGFTPELAAALLGAGPRGLERPLGVRALDLYAQPPAALGVSSRLAFRALWRRCLQAPLAPAVEARLLELAGTSEPRWGLLARFAAWRDPLGHRSTLKRFAEADDADGFVFAWRCLRRADEALGLAELERALRRSPADERLQGLLLEALEAQGIPASEGREDLRAVRSLVAELPALAELEPEIDLRCADPERVRAGLEALLARAVREGGFGSAVVRLLECYARLDPAREVRSGPRAAVFRALEELRPPNAAMRGAAAGFAREMGWILVGDLLLRSEGVDPIAAPRLRDLDPYEGGPGS